MQEADKLPSGYRRGWGTDQDDFLRLVLTFFPLSFSTTLFASVL
jgi:hypothetical protein